MTTGDTGTGTTAHDDEDQADATTVEITGEIGKPPDPPRRRPMIDWPTGT